jgi:hypothetical protein
LIHLLLSRCAKHGHFTALACLLLHRSGAQTAEALLPRIPEMTRSDYPDLGSQGYWINLMMLNIGMYRAMTAAPTAPPMMAIMRGSIREVSASTEADTSEL